MRRFAAALLLLLCLLTPAAALAENGAEGDGSLEDGVDALLDSLDLSAWEETLESLPESVRALWEGASAAELVRRVAGGGRLLPDGSGVPYLDALTGLVTGEISRMSGMLAALLGLAVVAGLAGALAEGGASGVADAASFVCRCVSLTYVLALTLALTRDAMESIGLLTRFMELALPALLTLLVTVGGTVSAGVLQPATAVLCGAVAAVMREAVIPLAVAGGVLGLMDQLTKRVRIGELAELAKKTSKWIIGAVSTLYLGSTYIRGMAAAAYDGVTVRTAKYAASSLVPMVGGMVSGTMDTVIGCAMLVKNAAGVTAILLAFGAALLPLSRIVAAMLLFRLSAALAQPLAGDALPGLYAGAADLLSYLFAATAAIALMFILTASLVTGLGSGGGMG